MNEMKKSGYCESAKPINVLHVVPSLAVRSGMVSVVENYRRFLDADEVCFDYLYFFDLPDNRKDEVEADGCRTFFLPFQDGKRPFRTIESFFAEHEGEFDILHCHPPFAPQLFARAAKRHGVKRVIAHSHSTKFSNKRLSAVRNRFLSKFLGFFATDYIACSEGARVLLGKHGKNAFILHNAIDCKKFVYNSEYRDVVRNELGLDENTLLLGGVGRLSPEKNQLFMLDILYELKKIGVDCKLAIAGSGNCKEVLINRKNELGLGEDLILLGNRADTPHLYSAFDAFLLPSFFEGMPISALEAQACGLPCFLSDAITREAAVGRALFLPIDRGARIWVDAIILARNEVSDRTQPTPALQKSGFDVSVEASNLTHFYKEILESASGRK